MADLDKFLPLGEEILAELNIDENTTLHLTENYLFVIDELGIEDIFLRRQIVHISFHLHDASDDDYDEWFGDDDNDLAFEIIDTSGCHWRFFLSEDLFANVTNFVKILLTTQHQTPVPAAPLTEENSASAPIKNNDDRWN